MSTTLVQCQASGSTIPLLHLTDIARPRTSKEHMPIHVCCPSYEGAFWTKLNVLVLEHHFHIWNITLTCHP